MNRAPISSASFQEIAKFLKLVGLPEPSIANLISTFRRRYKGAIGGYPTPDEIAKNLIVNSIYLPDVQQKESEVTSTVSLMCAQKLAVSNAPWYFLDKNLGKDLALTTPPDKIPNRLVLPPCGLIVLPCDLRDLLEDAVFLAYWLVSPGEKATLDLMSGSSNTKIRLQSHDSVADDNFYRLLWFAPHRRDNSIMGGKEVLFEDGNELIVNPYPELKPDSLALRASHLLINCLVYGEYSALHAHANYSPSGQIKTTKKGIPIYAPIWIGRGHQRSISTASSTSDRRNATHWRRGHWRRVAVGEKRCDRDWRWIRPVLVNSKDGRETQ